MKSAFFRSLFSRATRAGEGYGLQSVYLDPVKKPGFSPRGNAISMPTESLISSVLRATPSGVTLAVRAQPGAKKTAITGIYGEGDQAQLKIAIQAPPVEGKANAALIAFLAETVALPKNKIELVTGDSSRSKVFLLRGVTSKQVEAKLSELQKSTLD